MFEARIRAEKLAAEKRTAEIAEKERKAKIEAEIAADKIAAEEKAAASAARQKVIRERKAVEAEERKKKQVEERERSLLNLAIHKQKSNSLSGPYFEFLESSEDEKKRILAKTVPQGDGRKGMVVGLSYLDLLFNPLQDTDISSDAQEKQMRQSKISGPYFDFLASEKKSGLKSSSMDVTDRKAVGLSYLDLLHTVRWTSKIYKAKDTESDLLTNETRDLEQETKLLEAQSAKIEAMMKVYEKTQYTFKDVWEDTVKHSSSSGPYFDFLATRKLARSQQALSDSPMSTGKKAIGLSYLDLLKNNKIEKKEID